MVKGTYFIADEHGRVKIGGTATNPKNRMRQLQTGNGSKLKLLLFVSGLNEAKTQEKFRHLNVSDVGEWFYLSVELLEFISLFDNAMNEYDEEGPAIPDAHLKELWAIQDKKAEEYTAQEIYTIVREVEFESDSRVAPLSKVIERAAKVGFDKDIVEEKITYLVREARIFEPQRYTQEYRVTQP